MEGEWRSKEEDGDEQQEEEEEEEESSNISKRKRHSELTCFPFSTTMYRTERFTLFLSHAGTHKMSSFSFFSSRFVLFSFDYQRGKHSDTFKKVDF